MDGGKVKTLVEFTNDINSLLLVEICQKTAHSLRNRLSSLKEELQILDAPIYLGFFS